MSQQSDTGPFSGRRGLTNFLVIVALSRLVIMLLVGAVVDGNEFSDDVDNHMIMARDPLQILSVDTTPRYQSQPPLLPLMETVVAWPAQLLVGDFYAFRITTIVYETIMALFVWLALGALAATRRLRWWALGSIAVLPVGWMTSAVFGQEEVISAAFLALAAWLAIRGDTLAAVAVCGLGVVAGKVFLLFPLLALVLLVRDRPLWQRGLFGFAPVVLVQGWVFLLTHLKGAAAPLVEWNPPAPFAVNALPLITDGLGLTVVETQRLSGLLCLAGGLLPLAVVWRRRATLQPVEVLAVAGGMMAIVVGSFYATGPSYYLMVVPLILGAYADRAVWAMMSLLATIPWAVKLMWAVVYSRTGESGPGKRVFIDLYDRWIPISAETGWRVGMIAVTLLSWTMGLLVVRWLDRHDDLLA